MKRISSYEWEEDWGQVSGIGQDGSLRNDIVLRDVEHMISRFHCEFHNRSGVLYVVDKSSANGTSVNGQRVNPKEPVALRRGAKIEIGGSTVVQYEVEKRKRPDSREASA